MLDASAVKNLVSKRRTRPGGVIARAIKNSPDGSGSNPASLKGFHSPSSFGAAPSVLRLSTGQQVTGVLHLIFAVATFIALALMALRFAKTEKTPPGVNTAGRIRHALGLAKPADGERQPRTRWLKVAYRACGLTIFSCIVLAALLNLLPASVQANAPWLFIFEALAVFAFGVSWFVRGETLLPILKNQPHPMQSSVIGLQPAPESAVARRTYPASARRAQE